MTNTRYELVMSLHRPKPWTLDRERNARCRECNKAWPCPTLRTLWRRPDVTHDPITSDLR